MKNKTSIFDGLLKPACTIQQDNVDYIVRRVEENGNVIIFDIKDSEMKESILQGNYILTGFPITD